jgi:pyruvate dehydrogenase E1 component beta subunit
MATAIRAVLTEAMEADSSVVLLGESVGRDGGIAGTAQGLVERFGSERVRDVPVADRAMVAMGVGLALGGARPVVELTSTGRLHAVAEVLAEAGDDLGDFDVPLVVRVPYGGDAGPRIDRSAVDMIGSLKGVQVVCPRDASAAASLLGSALGRRSPTVILESRSLYDARLPVGPALTLEGRAEVLREGHHVTLVGWGTSVQTCLDVAELLEREKMSVEVVDLVSMAPLDHATVGASVRRTGRLVVVHPTDEAVAHRALQLGVREAFLYLESPMATANDTVEEAAQAVRSAVTY